MNDEFNSSNEYTKEMSLKSQKCPKIVTALYKIILRKVFCSIFRFNNNSRDLRGIKGIIKSVVKYTYMYIIDVSLMEGQSILKHLKEEKSSINIDVFQFVRFNLVKKIV